MNDLTQKITGQAQPLTTISRIISEAGLEPLSKEQALEIYRRTRREHEIEATKAVIEAQRAAKMARLERLYGYAGLPEKFKGRSLDTFTVYDDRIARVLDIANRYGTNFKKVRELGTCLSIIGNPGTGKTHIATAIIELALQQEYAAFFCSMSQILRDYRAAFKDPTRTENDVIAHYVEPDLLVIDEIGVAIGNIEKTQATLFDIFNERYTANKPTILLGNVTRQELADFLGERTFRRIQEKGGTVLACDWPAYNEKEHRQPSEAGNRSSMATIYAPKGAQ
jgi:DNA replication protein DnaC